jgi:hypothetical protein
MKTSGFREIKHLNITWFLVKKKTSRTIDSAERGGVGRAGRLAVSLLPHIANEGPVRIQYQWLVPMYVFPEMKLRSLVISKIDI